MRYSLISLVTYYVAYPVSFPASYRVINPMPFSSSYPLTTLPAQYPTHRFGHRLTDFKAKHSVNSIVN